MGGVIPIITSITIGCGTWGGNSVSENLTFRHLLNKTRVTKEIPELEDGIALTGMILAPLFLLKRTGNNCEAL